MRQEMGKVFTLQTLVRAFCQPWKSLFSYFDMRSEDNSRESVTLGPSLCRYRNNCNIFFVSSYFCGYSLLRSAQTRRNKSRRRPGRYCITRSHGRQQQPPNGKPSRPREIQIMSYPTCNNGAGALEIHITVSC